MHDYNACDAWRQEPMARLRLCVGMLAPALLFVPLLREIMAAFAFVVRMRMRAHNPRPHAHVRRCPAQSHGWWTSWDAHAHCRGALVSITRPAWRAG